MKVLYTVYVKIDSIGRIIAINSDAFLSTLEGWTKIDEGYGDRCHHAQGNYFPDPIYDDRGIPRYKLVDGKAVERTQEEMDADYVPPETIPTASDRMEAQVLYTAMMTDTLLEEE